MRTDKWIAWTVLGTVTLGLLAGCGGGSPGINHRMQAEKTEPIYDNRGIDLDGDGDRAWLAGHNNINNPPVNLRNMAPPIGGGFRDYTQGTYAGGVTADRIADLAQSIQGVDTASVVVNGQTAIVGLRLHRTVPRERAGAIAQEVRQLLMVQAPVFRSVRITTDSALARRVYDTAQKVRSGQPLSSLDQEIEQLKRDIPEVPAR
ncbi:YhcN/YlaJ family sporulation lipoprotein [Effusibacillus pohliae]|uniref:YhcN/YlaJ family sporulation lipoprotein n=1 Tax=Effusibacillus pohliae TaxID=232270 RepID=UPI000379402B|nr:YhcN/YlaJ family sporulation lipoprotein [Effusibacillus pohliae]